MREALIPLLGQRLTVEGTVLQRSKRIGWAGVRQPTILLGDLTSERGQLLADHLWLPLGRRLAALDLHVGDVVQFSGRASTYRRGLYREPGEAVTFEIDYCLSYPTRCAVVARAPQHVAKPVESFPNWETLPEPPPAPAPQASEQRPTNGDTLRATIAALAEGQEEPPSLPAIFIAAGLRPMAALKTLHKLAKGGAVAFTTCGRVYLTTEGSS